MYDSIHIEDLIKRLSENNQRLETRTGPSIVATQCLVCGHVEAPNPDPLRCPSCGQIGDDVHAFPAFEVV